MATLDSRITVGGEENLSLHEMFRIVGDQMTPRDVRVLKFLYIGVLPEDLWAQIHDGFTFLLALEKVGRCDASNFKHILHLLRIITRHDLTQYVTLRRRKTVVPDPVDLYLEETARSTTLMPSSLKRKYSALSEQAAPCSTQQAPAQPSPQAEAKLRRGRRSKKNGAKLDTQSPASPKEEGEIKKKVTCDIRLRVRAEYCHHDNALEGNIFSNKPELLERQFEKFTQANTILKSRDLGSIICDIKFSELTYLDAFWRDYINGSLLEALKGVFITESLKQAVGHEAIKLLVNVDEDDYEAGRIKLLQNLRD